MRKMGLVFKWDTAENIEMLVEIEITGERRDNGKGQVSEVPRADKEHFVL